MNDTVCFCAFVLSSVRPLSYVHYLPPAGLSLTCAWNPGGLPSWPGRQPLAKRPSARTIIFFALPTSIDAKRGEATRTGIV